MPDHGGGWYHSVYEVIPDTDARYEKGTSTQDLIFPGVLT